MTEYKAGDKVKCVQSAFTYLEEGGIYTVREFQENLGKIYLSEIADPTRWFSKSRFVKVQE